MKQYEPVFDDFYRHEWTHDSNIRKDSLHLDHYPYSVTIDLLPGQRWLELGIGSGRVLDYHSCRIPNDVRVIGLDYSLSALYICARHVPYPAKLLRGDIRHLPFKKNTMDLITLFGTIQATPRQHWPDVLSELLKLVKEGGKLGLSVHPMNYLEFLRCIRFPSRLRNTVTKTYLIKILDECGFKGKYVIEDHHINLILEKIYQLFSARTTIFFGFRELPKTENLTRLTRFMRKWMNQLTIGHYWIWIYK